MKPSRKPSIAGTAALVAVSLLALLPAGAGADPVAAGRTKLALDSSLFRALRQGGVAITGLRGARANGRFVGLPVKGGLIDLGTANGFVTHESGFRIRSGRRAVTLTQVGVDTGKSEVRARVDGQKMRIAAIPRFRYERKGFGDLVEAGGLRPTARFARTLDAALGLPGAFRPGKPFLSLVTNLQPEFDSLAGGTMRFSLDPGTVEKVRSLGVDFLPFEVTPEGGSYSYGATTTGGAIYPDLRNGFANIEGGLRIGRSEGPSPVITLADFGFSFETYKLSSSISVHTEAGQLAPAPGGPLAALDLSGATVRVDRDARTVTVSNARATLEAPIANLIDETFAKGKPPVIAAGDPLGTFALRLEGR
ncbi:MAG TPA: hypothetical protein VHA54_03115 [Solirubrobacterales bacterium]|nr:hypothetical protein [Solirubrobacterales bacterium]